MDAGSPLNERPPLAINANVAQIRSMFLHSTPTRALAAVFLTGLLLTAAPLAHAQTSPTALVQRWTDAVNANDLDTALSLLSDNVVIEGLLCNSLVPCSGHDLASLIIASFAGGGGTLALSDLSSADGTVTATARIRAPFLADLGIDRLLASFTAELVDGLIARLSLQPDLSDPQTAAFIEARDAAEENGVVLRPGALPLTGSGGLASEPTTDGVSWPTVVALASASVVLLLGAQRAIRR